MKYPKVAIVIPNFNGKRLLASCLKSVEKSTAYPNLEIIVVDNGSVDGSVEMVKKKFPKVLLIKNPKNLGFPKACNQGARLALRRGADYVLFLSNDTKILTEGWIEKLVEIASQDETIGVVGPKTVGKIEYPPTCKIYPSGLSVLFKQRTFPTSTIQVNLVAGVAFLVSKKLIDKIGFLDETFSPFLCEDIDYFIRTRKAGFKIIFTPDVVVNHIHSATIGKIAEERQDFVYFVYKRNSLVLARKHFSFLWFLWEIAFGLAGCFFVKKDPNRAFQIVKIKPNKRFFKRINLLLKAIVSALSI